MQVEFSSWCFAGCRDASFQASYLKGVVAQGISYMELFLVNLVHVSYFILVPVNNFLEIDFEYHNSMVYFML